MTKLNDVIYQDGDTIIGYSQDIAYDMLDEIGKTEHIEDKETFAKLAVELLKLDYELVIIYYHPMGAYTCYKLEKGVELFYV